MAGGDDVTHTFDTSLRFTGSGAPLTSNYTCGAGSTVLVLALIVAGATARTGGAPTYNGVAMTQADQVRTATETNSELWYLIGPPTGSALQISIPNTGTAKTIHADASTFKAGTGYVSAFDVANGNAATGTGSANPGVAVTPTVNGAGIVQCLGDGNINAPTGQSHTLIQTTDNGSYSDSEQYALQDTAANITLSWTVPADDWCICMAAFKPVAIVPSISSVSPSTFDNAQTSISITGTGFLAAQGTGKVELSDSSTYGGGTLVDQTETAWGDTSITITAVLGSLTPGTLYLFVTSNNGQHSAAYTVTVHREKMVFFAASPYVAAGGADAVSTSRLTAPPGKSGNFTPGVGSDDTNPSGAVNITASYYSENVYVLKIASGVANGTVIELRLTKAGTPFETYSQTPTVTVSSGGAATKVKDMIESTGVIARKR